MKINIHAGHNRIVPGASKYLDEVKEDRIVTQKLVDILSADGYTVYNTTDNKGRSQKENLENIVRNCNLHNVNLDISIHLNSGGGTGVEVYQYNNNTDRIAYKICEKISSRLGIRNRGVKNGSHLYVLKYTKAPAILIECCFVDNEIDYNEWGGNICAEAIGDAIKSVYPIDDSNPGYNIIARQVIEGHYGNGRRRRENLKRMGYDPDKVQRIVNEMLR